MYTNCTFDSIKPLKYGYGFIANALTFKTRYKTAEAERVYQAISPDNRKHLSMFYTRTGHAFVAIVCHSGHPIWQELAYIQSVFQNEKIQAKADKKIAIAEKKLAEAHQLLNLLPPPPQVIILDAELPF
jgi:hypothetical protein